jgi:hypothetical protein
MTLIPRNDLILMVGKLLKVAKQNSSKLPFHMTKLDFSDPGLSDFSCHSWHPLSTEVKVFRLFLKFY